MTQLYRITPQEKKSIEYFVYAYEQTPDGVSRGFEVVETWRWGQGFRPLDEPVYENEIGEIHCDPQVGWGCELDDLISVRVDFSDGFTDEEKAFIESILCGEKEDEESRWGTAWLYDGHHNWQVEWDHVAIYGPVKIDLIDEDVYNVAIDENVAPLKYEPVKGWPFPSAEKA